MYLHLTDFKPDCYFGEGHHAESGHARVAWDDGRVVCYPLVEVAMSLWQSTMIGLARSKSITGLMQGSRLMRGLAGSFVGGDSSSAAIGTSVVTSKAAICGHFKTGHMDWPET